MNNIDQINDTLIEYFNFKAQHSPYKGIEWKTNGSIAINCKNVLDRMSALLTKFIDVNAIAPAVVKVRAANGAAYYPRSPWIGFFFPGEEPKNGVYPVIGFFESNAGLFVGCVESVDRPQEGFGEEFCNLARQNIAGSNREIFEQELRDQEHIAFPVHVFRRGERIEREALKAALVNAFEIRSQYRNSHPMGLDEDSRVVDITSTYRAAPQTLGELIDQFESVKGAFSDLSRWQREMSFAYDKNEKETHRLLAYIEELKKQANSLELGFQKEREKVANQTLRIEKDAQKRLDEFVRLRESELETMRQDLSSMLSSATAGLLSSHFDAKRRVVEKSLKSLTFWFVVSILMLSILGAAFAYVFLWREVAFSAAGTKSLAFCLIRAVSVVTVYAPLLWLTCHINRSVVQSKRLAEEYAHKVVVARTYVGLSRQMSQVLKEREDMAVSMSARLLDGTIKALTTNPNYVFDKAKTTMPLSIIADDVSKIGETIGKHKFSQ